MLVDRDAVSQWFRQYIDTFAACVRGDDDIDTLLRFYGVPMIITSDDGAITVTTEDEAAAVMQGEMDALRSVGYHHTKVTGAEVTVLNAASALYTVELSRRNGEGDEIDCATITYLITEMSGRLEIAVRAVHT